MVDASAGVVSVKRVEEIMNAEIEPSGTETIALDTKVAICFDEVDFGYVEENRILNGFVFRGEEGRKCCICR